MILQVDENMKIKAIEEEPETRVKTIQVVLPKQFQLCKSAVRVESITMIDYVPVIKGIATMPEKFYVCRKLELSIFIQTDKGMINTGSVYINC